MNSQFKTSLIKSPEGRILIAGVAIALVYTLWLGTKLIFSPDDSQILVGVTATQVLFGRAASMAFGYSLGLGHKTIIPVCITIETILVLIFYPLFVFSWRHLLVIKWLKKLFAHTQKTAEMHKAKIQRYGIIGLLVFVWFPFWMTGPMVGCVIGFLLGLRPRTNISIVLTGTYVAILGWAYFLGQFHKQMAPYSSYATMVLVLLLIAILALGYLLFKTLNERRNQ